VQETALCPAFLAGAFGFIVPGLTVCPAQAVRWGNITVPALVVDGALDRLTGADASQTLLNAQTLFDDLASTNKQLIVFPRNSHGWFLEDNHDVTDRVFDRFLSQF
jgi:pimeloyl-ACP methyl ester carboxylesterase